MNALPDDTSQVIYLFVYMLQYSAVILVKIGCWLSVIYEFKNYLIGCLGVKPKPF